MEDSNIYFGDTTSTYTPAELADKIYDEGKTKVKNLFQAYKTEMDYNLSQPHLAIEKKQKLITDEIEKLGLTKEMLTLAKSPTKQKRLLIESLEMILGSLGERKLPMRQFDIHTSTVSYTLATLKKSEYLKKEFEKYDQIPEIGEKIKWLGTSSEFGLLINELTVAGYLENADHKRDKNKKSWLGTAKLLFNAFHVPDLSRMGETSIENISNEIRDPSISNKEAGFFKITRRNRK